MNTKNAIISVIFIAIGIALIYSAFMRPCDVEQITQQINGEVAIEQPEQLDRLLCLSTDPIALVSMLIGIAAIFPGIGGLFKSLTAESPAGKSKKKKKK
jgi:hypothetical protein